jgi:hypothetical protein
MSGRTIFATRKLSICTGIVIGVRSVRWNAVVANDDARAWLCMLVGCTEIHLRCVAVKLLRRKSPHSLAHVLRGRVAPVQ